MPPIDYDDIELFFIAIVSGVMVGLMVRANTLLSVILRELRIRRAETLLISNNLREDPEDHLGDLEKHDPDRA